MGEGIERTLARAVELETLVHTEVNELERAYSKNEMRIRTLVDGLGSERDALISHAERVRSSISGAHETLREELGSPSDMIRDNILAASTKLSMTITGSGDTLIDRINESGVSIFDSIDQRLGVISDRLTTSGGVIYHRHRFFVNDQAPGYDADVPSTWQPAIPLVTRPTTIVCRHSRWNADRVVSPSGRAGPGETVKRVS